MHNLEPGVDFTAMAAAQRNDEEMATYHTATSRLVLQDVQFGPTDTTLSATSPRGSQGLSSQLSSARLSLTYYMASCIPPSEPRKNYLPTDMFGMAFASKLAVGQGPVNLARRPRFSDIPGPGCKLSMCHTGDSTTST